MGSALADGLVKRKTPAINGKRNFINNPAAKRRGFRGESLRKMRFGQVLGQESDEGHHAVGAAGAALNLGLADDDRGAHGGDVVEVVHDLDAPAFVTKPSVVDVVLRRVKVVE